MGLCRRRPLACGASLRSSKEATLDRRARPPSGRAARRLRVLLARKQRLEEQCTRAANELAVAALDICEGEGASRRLVAEALGVGTSTVQGWVNRGRQVRRGER
jgi:DNA-directed RNA polymerase specialized sigma24 family protein